MHGRPTRRTLSQATLLLLLAILPTAATLPPLPWAADAVDPAWDPDEFRVECGTGLDELVIEGLLPESAFAPSKGTPVFFKQVPPILLPSHTGSLTLDEFTVSGNVRKLEFQPYMFDTNATVPSRQFFKRVAKRKIDGVTVSVFRLSWPEREVERFLQNKSHGWDRGEITWGYVHHGGDRTAVRLRIGSTNLSDVNVVRVNDTVSYTSHVANLVIPGYGNDRATKDSFSIQDTEVTKKFYERFKDDYDVIRIVPAEVPLPGVFTAFHRRVKAQVQGLGQTIKDNSANYGSNGRLFAVEFYTGARATRNSTTVHELAHQWGHHFDWGRIAGLNRAGHQTSAHTPLLYSDETLIGAVLEGNREVIMTTAAPGPYRTREQNGFEIG